MIYDCIIVVAGTAGLTFSLLGVIPNNRLARDLEVALAHHEYVRVNEYHATNVPGLYAAGDISRMHTHQVASAVHEGAEAAPAANCYLYSDYQKL